MLVRLVVRTILLLAAAGLIVGVVYVPIRLILAPERPPQRNERRFQERRLPPYFGIRVVVKNLVAVAVVAGIGRGVLRLSLKR
jgi:hypothetical protein